MDLKIKLFLYLKHIQPKIILEKLSILLLLLYNSIVDCIICTESNRYN